MTSFVPVNEPLLAGNEIKYLTECVETGWISSEGRFVDELETRIAQLCGRKFGVAVANGSVALDAAVLALGIGPGDEVILPSLTIISCAAAIVRAGAIPVVVDSEPDTWNMDVGQVERRITPRTKAIMPVHVYGLPVDMDPLLELARARGLAVLEDAAEVLGQTYKSRPCGSFGDASTLSFYPNKHVTTGEGGMILTDDDAIASHCRSLRNLCFQPQRRFVHEELGFNFRMSNLQAAVGVAQAERIEDNLRRKREIGARYQKLLGGVPGLELPVPGTAYAENLYWVFGLVLSDDVPFDAEAAMKKLGSLGVGTRPFFWPMHEQPVLQRMGWFAGEHHPVAERLARRGFYVPSGLALTDEQIEQVADAVRQVMA